MLRIVLVIFIHHRHKFWIAFYRVLHVRDLLRGLGFNKVAALV
jgi:hypothetical protein